MKSKISRLIFIAFILTVASACAVSGTLAQFITTDSGSDTIFIAEWGVTVAVEGQYIDGTEQSLMSSTTDSSAGIATSSLTVAPGESGYFTFGWSGTPEVDVDISVADSMYNMVTYTENDLAMSSVSMASGYTIDQSYYSGLYGSWLGASGQYYEPVIWNLYVLEDDTVIDNLSEEDNLIGQFESEYITNVEYEYSDPEEMSSSNTGFTVEQTQMVVSDNSEYDYNSYENLCSTLNSIYFEYEAGTDITAKYIVTWEWPLNADDMEASLNDTFLADIVLYDYDVNGNMDYFCILENTETVTCSGGDILTYDEYIALSTSEKQYATYLTTPYLIVALTVTVEQSYAESTIRDTDVAGEM